MDKYILTLERVRNTSLGNPRYKVVMFDGNYGVLEGFGLIKLLTKGYFTSPNTSFSSKLYDGYKFEMLSGKVEIEVKIV